MMVFMKHAIYESEDYMTELTAESLRNQIISKLNSDPDIQFLDVEIRTYRKFINVL